MFRARGACFALVSCAGVRLSLLISHLTFLLSASNLYPLTFSPFRLQHRMTATLYTYSLQGTQPTTCSGTAVFSPSMGTPLLQQISLMNNGVLQKIEETPPDSILKSRLEIRGLNNYKTGINSPRGSQEVLGGWGPKEDLTLVSIVVKGE